MRFRGTINLRPEGAIFSKPISIVKLLFIFIILLTLFIQKRAYSVVNVNVGDAPQKGNFASKPGHYELAVRQLNSVVDPAGTMEIELFITGYGTINSAKLVFYVPGDVFDENESTVTSEYKRKSSNSEPPQISTKEESVSPGDVFIFGGNKKNIKGVGMTISFGGFKPTDWKYPTMFFDVPDGEPPQISTEQKLDSAPVHFILKILRTAKPGTYYVGLYFTYYNGVEWKGSSQQVQFTIRNILQRNELLAWVFGIMAAASTVIVAIFTVRMKNWIRWTIFAILVIFMVTVGVYTI